MCTLPSPALGLPAVADASYASLQDPLNAYQFRYPTAIPGSETQVAWYILNPLYCPRHHPQQSVDLFQGGNPTPGAILFGCSPGT